MSDDDRAAEILADWYDRRERGEINDPNDVVRAHPDVADALAAHFAAQAMFDKIAGRTPAASSGAPATLGEYRVLRELGRGGMGVVYEAEQTTMRPRVVLKVLLPTVTSSRSAVERFQREARAARRLHHTNIGPVHWMGQERGVWFYAMELVVGRPLDEVIDDARRLGKGAKRLSAAGHRDDRIRHEPRHARSLRARGAGRAIRGGNWATNSEWVRAAFPEEQGNAAAAVWDTTIRLAADLPAKK